MFKNTAIKKVFTTGCFILCLLATGLFVACGSKDEETVSTLEETATLTDTEASITDAQVTLTDMPETEEIAEEAEEPSATVTEETEAATEADTETSTVAETTIKETETEEEPTVSETSEQTTTKEIVVTTTEAPTTTEATTKAVSYTEVDETVYVITTVSLNVRSGPGTSYNKLGTLSYGESVHRTGVGDNGWSRIEYKEAVAYVASKYVSTTKPAEQTTTAKVSSSSYPMTYSDSTATITITKEKYAGSWCYIAHLKFTDYTRFGTACGNGTYGGYETTSHAAKRLGAIFCVNGDYCTPSYGAPVARQGVCYSSGGHEDIGYYSFYTGILASPASMGVSGTDLKTLVANGTVTDTFCFLHIAAGLVDGQVIHKADTSRAQRTFIGTNGNPGDIYIVVSEGRKKDGVSAGLTFDESMSLLQSKGCTFGLMLDGGGSSTMYFNGKVLNSASGSERSVVDFVFFK